MSKQRVFRVLAALVTTIGTAGALALGAAGSAAADAGSSAHATGTNTTSTTVKLENGGNCLLTFGSSLAWQPCSKGAGDQKWTRESASYGLYKFYQNTVTFGRLCLDSAAAGHVSICARGVASQRLSVTRASHNLFKIAHYKRCLDFKYGFATCHQGDGYQRWSVPNSP